ncbi:hypothetical protein [Methylomonas methanica]|uniref:hypothetical protein n=1 Tax=Methylomonas methanica TaxID=421 RepID=UPI0002F49A54|nr:hypothetical protein [Methylomonas methanica]
MNARLDVLPFADAATSLLRRIRTEQAKNGLPIGSYDLIIAGHAPLFGIDTATNNLREFQRVPGLRLENWIE